MAFNPRYNFKRTFHAPRHPPPPPHNSFFEIFAAPPPPARNLHEEEIVAARRKKTRSLLDIDLNAPHQGGDAPAAVAAFGSAAAKGINTGGVVEKVLEESRERRRRRRRWEALLDAAAIAVIHEYERNIGMEDMEYQAENRIRKPRKFGVGGCGGGSGGDYENSWSRGDRRRGVGGAWGFEAEAVAAAAQPHRSKRGRALALPNKYKDSVFEGAAMVADENEEKYGEFSRRRKWPASIVDADRKPRRVYRYQEW